ncbi:MAG: sulfatase [Acidobacteriota bacterium]
MDSATDRRGWWAGGLVGAHLLLSGTAAGWFAWHFAQGWPAATAHVAVLAAWDVLLLVLLAAVTAVQPAWSLWACRLLPAATFVCQMFLYALNAISNVFWGRNITGHLVVAFAPTVWSGKESFPIGALGITGIVLGTTALAAAVSRSWGRTLDDAVRSWVTHGRPPARPTPRHPFAMAATAAIAITVFGAAMAWAVRTDRPFWKHELVVSAFRPNGFAFEPTARRQAAAERDAVLRAAYPRHVEGARRKHVVLIIIDSLRADHMQVYGYHRPTTPFLSRLVESGRMQRVEAAFSTCSESFCGITSTLSGRDFRDINARDFQLQDVLRDQGYRTWFLLSGNHRVWNGLPQFYHADEGTLFDGSQTTRYTTDDDRLVLEGLERVPAASQGQPAFFYVHLMSTHYLGVQLPESHVFTSQDDRVSPGPEPYSILERLNKPDRYDDKVRQADDIIRQLFDALSAKHYLDDAVVVVTADHGEGLGERHWAHGWHLYDEDIRIPLLLYDAPPAPYRNLTFATQVDIAPTILDRLGLPIPASWDGQSLLAPTIKQFSFHQTYFLPNRFAVLYRSDHGLFKYIATPQYGKEELYGLTDDRGETHSLVADQPALVALLRDKLHAYLTEGP